MHDTQPQIVHGTVLLVHHVGVLLQGAPNCGKSELALALLDRGHILIADDAVTLSRHNNTLTAVPTEPHNQKIYLRSIGTITPQHFFTHQATQPQSHVNLLIQLTHATNVLPQYHLNPNAMSTFLSVKIPSWTLYLPSPIDLALKVETIVKKYKMDFNPYLDKTHTQANEETHA
jgi:HPr kinase/phosphorylase